MLVVVDFFERETGIERFYTLNMTCSDLLGCLHVSKQELKHLLVDSHRLVRILLSQMEMDEKPLSLAYRLAASYFPHSKGTTPLVLSSSSFPLHLRLREPTVSLLVLTNSQDRHARMYILGSPAAVEV